jgi:hypothetical protein
MREFPIPKLHREMEETAQPAKVPKTHIIRI